MDPVLARTSLSVSTPWLEPGSFPLSKARESRRTSGGSKWSKRRRIPSRQKAKRAYEEKGGGGLFSLNRSGFRVFTYEFESVERFTEPNGNSGVTASQVNYLVSPGELAAWAEIEGVRKVFPEIERSLEKNQKKSAVLVLANDGWIHRSQM